jgi:hypothetical protein
MVSNYLIVNLLGSLFSVGCAPRTKTVQFATNDVTDTIGSGRHYFQRSFYGAT